MPILDLEKMEAFAARLALEAGKGLREHFGTRLEVEYKGEGRRDPLTNADRESQEYLQEAIRREYPDHGIIGEEDHLCQAPKGCETIWVLDPLDGTKNFMNGLPLYGVSIGVLEEGRPIVGAVWLPCTTDGLQGVFHARKGGGAFADGRRLTVSPGEIPQGDQLISLPGTFFRRWRFAGRLKKEWWGEARSIGSIVYELAYTAAGTFHYAVFGGPKIWDVAAGILLIQEARGEVLVRPGGRGEWMHFESFGPTLKPESLRKWNEPLLAGNPEVVRLVASSLRRKSLGSKFSGIFSRVINEKRKYQNAK